MVAVDPLLSGISDKEGLHWEVKGEYGRLTVILFHIVHFLVCFISMAICIKT